MFDISLTMIDNKGRSEIAC